MSDLHRPQPEPTHTLPANKEDPDPKGPNLVLYFSLVALALLTAISLALLIVRPFYVTRH